MKTRGSEQLFPNENIYKNNVESSGHFKQIVNQINKEKLGKTQAEQKQAYLIISNWVSTILNGMEFALRSQNIPEDQLSVFKQEFDQKLKDFINHLDHGIVHSYHVYRGMIHLSELNDQPIVFGSQEDKEAQLLALLHDINQVVPFTLKDTKFSKRYSHPKNDHAKIISDLTRIFGKLFGFDRKKTKEIAYGLEHHDASYDKDKTYLLNNFDYPSQLLHDADKIFGASLETDIESLTIGMLERNYQANKGAAGAYLFREEIPKEIRDVIKYGDRCLTDASSLVRAELHLQMCTPSAKIIAEQRRNIANRSIRKVYGKYFDLTHNYIYNNIPEILAGNKPNLRLSIVGMDQTEQPISNSIKDLSTFETEINRLYNTPIHISDEDKFTDRYGDNHARGLKIRVYNSDDNSEIHLDPSIARFCFNKNGRQEFLDKLVLAFQNGLH